MGDHTTQVVRGVVRALLLLAFTGCDSSSAPGDGALPIGACTTDDRCDDGVFCNGVERCVPTDPRADAAGCVLGMAAPCVADQVCIEAEDRCETICERTRDADGDGRAALECGGDDCDDADAERYPGNTEVCDPEGHDEDCDPDTLGPRDADGDGSLAAVCCNPDGAGGTRCGEDCDDLRASVRPGATEVCNGFDDDCDGSADEGVLVAGFADLDGDLHGDPEAAAMACPGAAHFSTENDDCDDTRREVHGAQVEICDGRDNDCDGVTDEETRPVTWYVDGDGDGFGRASGGTTVACVPPEGYALLPFDCDDDAAGVNPAATERCNGLDDDCNGLADYAIGPNDFEDDDGDGRVDDACVGFGDDCDDTDPDTYPGAPSLCDGRDRDCDGTPDVDGEPRPWYLDRDRDGHGDPDDVTMVCAPPAGRVTRGDDCDDSSAAIAPGAVDRCGGGDDDCDGTIDEDAAQIAFYADGDGDGSGGGEPVLACAPPTGHGLFPMDCDDADATQFPGNVEVCDGDDEDCDGMTDEGGDALCVAPGANARCTAAGCVIDACTGGLLDCDRDPSTGCEVDPSADSAHCGACDVSCGPYAHASGMCVAGACDFDCDAGYADCDLSSANDCESELLTSPIDCGACGNRCPAAANATPACAAGSCTIECMPGFEDCNGMAADGCESVPLSDPANCGTCGNACAGADALCVRGACQTNPFGSDGSEDAFMPTSSMVLPAGVHQFTEIIIPAGVTITTDGDGVLDLRASGRVVVNGVINVSGARGGGGASASACPSPRVNGGGGDTGIAGGVGATGVDTGCQPRGGGGSGAAGTNGGACGAGGLSTAVRLAARAPARAAVVAATRAAAAAQVRTRGASARAFRASRSAVRGVSSAEPSKAEAASRPRGSTPVRRASAAPRAVVEASARTRSRISRWRARSVPEAVAVAEQAPRARPIASAVAAEQAVAARFASLARCRSRSGLRRGSTPTAGLVALRPAAASRVRAPAAVVRVASSTSRRRSFASTESCGRSVARAAPKAAARAGSGACESRP
ncbi:MAG: putative metal-binding motif-containing protein [Polyangiales bacterium]